MNKTLKYVVIFIVSVSLGGVLAAFLLPKSFKYKHEFTIEKPLAEVWEVIRSDERRADWVDMFDRIEHREGTPSQVGAIRAVRYTQDTSDFLIIETIQELDSPFHIKYKEQAQDLYTLIEDLTLVELDSNRTLFTSEVSASTDNRLFKFMMFGLKKGLKEHRLKNLERLKEIIEKGGLEAQTAVLKDSSAL